MESNYSSSFLFCDEELELHPLPITPSSLIPSSPSSTVEDQMSSREECEHVFRQYLQKENAYKAGIGYSERLDRAAFLSASRNEAVRMIISVSRRLQLSYETSFGAVNYLDCVISMNCYRWDVWLTESLAIACLFIATKVDDSSGPSLYEIVMTAGLTRTYTWSTFEEMEVTVLKALNWRVHCVTPYSYLSVMVQLIGSPHAALTDCATAYLLLFIFEPKFLKYRSSAIAISALQCSLEELVPLKSDAYLSILHRLMPFEYQVEAEMCYRIMKEKIASCPVYPITVIIPMEETEVSDNYIDLDLHLGICNKNSSDFNAIEKGEEVDTELHL